MLRTIKDNIRKISPPLLAITDIKGPEAFLSNEIKAAISRTTDFKQYTTKHLNNINQWVVAVGGGQSVDKLAQRLGAKNLGKTGVINNAYVFEFSSSHNPNALGQQLKQLLGEIEWFSPLVAKKQTLKSVKYTSNDPLYGDQWHLRNIGQGGGTPGADANVSSAWNLLDNGNNPILGTGVVIGIVDDGLQYTHPDLNPAYRADLSYDFNFNDSDPSPGSWDDHGTSVAGVAAARGNNGIGVSGVAPNASLAGLRLIAGGTTDQLEANALDYKPQNISIYSNSWGPADDGARLEGPGPLTLAAFAKGITQGRGGKGNIYVWAAGNGLANNDNSNYDGYANSRYVIAVAAITNQNQQAWYSEPGANILVAAPSNGGTLGITTTDRTGSEGYNGLPDTNYTNQFGGTSSATPLVAGVAALMLQANPNLGWRDVQKILALSAKKINTSDPAWVTNGAGLKVNDKYGFGVVDATAAVQLAKTWTNLGPEVSYSSGLINVNTPIPDNNSTGISKTFNVNQDLKVEKVEVILDASHTYRGDLNVSLVSPSGTVSQLAQEHLSDSGDDYLNWTFSTVRDMGESSLGNWTLKVSDTEASSTGTWNSWQLKVYGTTNGPTAGQLSAGDVTVVEGNVASAVFPVTLSSASTQTVTVKYGTANGTASAGFDYTSITGVLTFAPGQTRKTVSVPIINDNLNELEETFNLNLSAPTNATLFDNLGVGTISDIFKASVTTTLSANVENLALTGTANINGIGNNNSNIITGNTGNNSLNGGAGNDSLNGGAGNDSLDGGAGNDSYLFAATAVLGSDQITETTTGGIDTLDFSGTTNGIRLNLGLNTVQTVAGSNLKLRLTANNVIENATGASGNDTIIGNSLNNVLSGSAGSDQLYGNSGNDSLIGGAGNDLLVGGIGKDSFVYQTGKTFVSTDVGTDTLSDFSSTDKIVLSKTTFNTLASIIGNGFSQASDFAVVLDDDDVAASTAKIVYSSNSGSLYYNQNGSAAGLGSGAEFANVNTETTITASNFVIQA